MPALVAAIAASLLWLAPAEAQQPAPGAKPAPGAQPAPAPRVNLAKGKRAMQSSVGYDGKPELAIDGNRNPAYDAKTTTHTADGDKMPWWQIDLGAVYKVDHIRIFNRADPCCRERIVGANLMVSDQPFPNPDGMASQRKKVFPIKDVRPVYDFPIGGAPVRFVRVQLPKPGALSLAEVEIFGAPTPLAGPVAGTPPGQPPQQLVNLTRGKRATQSSEGYGGKAVLAIDGNKNPDFNAKSISHTADGDKLPWWEVDLGAVHKVVAIRVFNRADCCAERLAAAGAVVLVSDQPFPNPNGMASQRKRVFPIQGVKPMYDFPTGGMPARFVRVQMQKPGALHLAEIEVIGEPRPMQPPAPPKKQ